MAITVQPTSPRADNRMSWVLGLCRPHQSVCPCKSLFPPQTRAGHGCRGWGQGQQALKVPAPRAHGQGPERPSNTPSRLEEWAARGRWREPLGGTEVQVDFEEQTERERRQQEEAQKMKPNRAERQPLTSCWPGSSHVAIAQRQRTGTRQLPFKVTGTAAAACGSEVQAGVVASTGPGDTEQEPMVPQDHSPAQRGSGPGSPPGARDGGRGMIGDGETATRSGWRVDQVCPVGRTVH